ncbi:hypothetical protein SASPL_112627 [Salvia splendens]|uniref:signal peptidase I n=2 Tax=Magnoliopsida TaxID=3398 RepID=A0A8X8Y950_SALSN|nr:hypothetical protein SASPL_112627 [Salvia splendens]
MGWIGEQIDSIKSLNFRQVLTQAVSLGMIVTSALIIWKGLMCVTGSESPVVVVLSGSMEPGFKRGDILFLHMSKDPIRAGEIVVFNVDGREIPIVHRVIKVHEREDTGEVDVLTKGDNNFGDDRLLYAQGQLWLQRHHIMGRAVGFLPYVGWVTIIMTEKPIIKQSISLNNFTLSSWNTTNSNCCTWNGVVCSVPTGHVHGLHLSSHSLHGNINLSTLLRLKHLTYLDLSHNQFQGAIPPSIARLKNLEYLNLSNAGFHGVIPRSIGNLSSLRTLVLEGSGQKVHELGWLSCLVRLKHLNMNFIDLRNETNWLGIIDALPHLAELHLRGCKLLSPLSTLDHVNATSLTFLDLSRNELASFSTAGWIFRKGSLRFLDMSQNYIEGHVPYTSNTTKLQHIDLSWNKLSSVIPDWIYSRQDLKFVYLGNNFLNGTISKRVANLTSLDTFSLSYNQISGEIPSEITSLCAIRILDLSVVTLRMRENKLSGHLTNQFGKFKKLGFLDLTINSISGVIPDSLCKSSCLRILWLAFNKLSGELPMSIGQLFNLESLTFGRNKLEGVVNETHFEKLTKLKYLFASGNNLSLKVSPNWIPPFQLVEEIGIGSWNLGTAEIPSWINELHKNVSVLDLSDTGLSGEVPTWVWGVSILNLSHNQFHGEIPDFKPWKHHHAFPYQRRMYLSSNRFSGSLPRVSYDMLELDLSNNSFSGSLSHFLCDATFDTYVKILHLGNNLISGEIPNCWMKWSSL